MNAGDWIRSRVIPPVPFRLITNPRRGRQSAETSAFPDVGAARVARQEIATWPGYRPTPLIDLRGVAASLGIRGLRYKDEGARFLPQSFKAVGGAYAVARLTARQVARVKRTERISSHELLDGQYRHVTEAVTVTCATDGNHGRAVAWSAREFGCRAVIYMAHNVTEQRERAMAAFGAEVVRSDGNHEEAMRQCITAARERGWSVISETENASEPAIAQDILSGYMALLDEAWSQMPSGELPTHVFIQVGVGGLAATTSAYTRERFGTSRPALVTVEAEAADCLLRSIEAGERVAVTGQMDTIMAGLAAGEVSGPAWFQLASGADFCMAIPDEPAVATMRLLAEAPAGDQPVAAGESGVAGLAAALLATQDHDARSLLGITAESRILTIGTEGATDEDLYRRLVGRSAASVRALTSRTDPH